MTRNCSKNGSNSFSAVNSVKKSMLVTKLVTMAEYVQKFFYTQDSVVTVLKGIGVINVKPRISAMPISVPVALENAQLMRSVHMR